MFCGNIRGGAEVRRLPAWEAVIVQEARTGEMNGRNWWPKQLPLAGGKSLSGPDDGR